MSNYEPHQAPRKRRPGCLSIIGGTVVAVIILIIIVAVIAAVGSSDDGNDGPITASGNTEHPPADDIELTECGPGAGNPAGGSFVGAAGQIVNHSSKASNYVFVVEFVTPDGTRYAEAPGAANAVAPGQTVEWGAPTVEATRDGTECRVTQVERFAA